MVRVKEGKDFLKIVFVENVDVDIFFVCVVEREVLIYSGNRGDVLNLSSFKRSKLDVFFIF